MSLPQDSFRYTIGASSGFRSRGAWLTIHILGFIRAEETRLALAFIVARVEGN